MLKRNIVSAVSLAGLSGLLASGSVLAAKSGSGSRIEEVTIIGSTEDVKKVPGSAYVMDEADLAIFNHSDINRILSEAPGVYLIEEEGFGLRPNIGIRGSGTERSGKITLLEDGILVAPAPYSNPEAYYFPTAGRMSGIEVLKGPTLLKEGPYTVGGAVNMLSTPIPDDYSGNAILEVGERGANRLFANYGGSDDGYGWLLETEQRRGDGFKEIDRSSVDTGFEVQDYVAKVRINTPSGSSAPYQSLVLKAQYSEETSNSGYLGLTDVDFDDDPNRRYGLTAKDQMNNRHTGLSASYFIEVSEQVDLQLTGYYSKFKRDWFKVDKIDGSSLSSVIGAANNGDAAAIGVLHGTENASVDILHNNREYESKGVQASLDWVFNTGGIGHALNAGVRVHRDEMDRFQPTELDQQINGSLVNVGVEPPTGGNNREEEGKATAFWLMDTVSLGERVELTLVVRHEDIETQRREYADTERNTLAPDSKQRSNETSEWLPGIGLTWQVADSWQLLAGVHQGMSPAGAGATADTDPEMSTNYEAGFRFDNELLNAEMVGFYSDYSNSIVNCSLAHPCANGETSGTEQLGEAEIKGLEASMGLTPQTGALQWPLRVSYTFTDAQITEDSADGSVLKGDEYQYIPRHLFYARAGVVSSRGWDAYVSARFIDAMCIDFSCERDGADNRFRETDSLWVFDLVTHYQLTESAQVYLKVDNLLDEQKIVSRSPAGARSNQPRTAMVGLNLSF
jgi:Fe(3+) dicitrate transport protein